jgi:uncharacterized membrane protein
MKRVALLVLLWVGTASGGGGTGGSMGGGSFSGGGSHSSSSSSGGYHSSSSSSSGGYHSSSSYSGGGCDNPGDASGVIIFLVIGLAIWGGVALMAQQKDASRGLDYEPMGDDIEGVGVDVTVLRIAIDGRSRKFLQSELARIAKIADTATPEGRVTMVREVALTVRRLRDAWVYGGAVNEDLRDIGTQQQVFQRWVNDARARFREETVRNEGGVQTSTAASQYTPRSDEGAGLVLISIIIAARRELFTVRQIGSGEDLRGALDSIGTLDTNTLVAVEIVWQPSEDSDRMSSMELEAMYPTPQIVPIQGALVGKTFCTYCGGPFPAELVSCPHCGAPAPGRSA